MSGSTEFPARSRTKVAQSSGDSSPDDASTRKGPRAPLRVLVVDDDELSLSALVALVRREGFEVVAADSLAGAHVELEARPFAALLVDQHLPDGFGLELAGTAADAGADFILVTGMATIDTVLEALRAGATDVLTKPVDEARLKLLLDGLARTGSYRRELAELREELRSFGRFGSMLGSSSAMEAVYDRIARVAPTDASILIRGESGTGKELVAETVHRLSRRSHRSFVAVNCGAIPPSLIESELFGHERGAFTGAERQRQGLFERAHQGTLFLDEISEMPIDLQVRLLRVLETGTYQRVGGEKALRADFRVIAASNRDLDRAVADGTFRADLRYRLRVVEIQLPPLRERGDDLTLLALHFLSEQSIAAGVVKRFRRDALEAITRYSFPGNVRELRNVVQQAFILADEEIRTQHLPAELLVGPGAGIGSPESASADDSATWLRVPIPACLSEVERRVVLATLNALGGRKNDAANVLGISLKTLYSRLREYGAREEGEAVADVAAPTTRGA